MDRDQKAYRVGYFTHTSIGVSETFLDKLLGTFALEFNVLFFCGEQQSQRSYPCAVRFLGFGESPIEQRYGSFLSRVRRRFTTSAYRIDAQQRVFTRRFKRAMAQDGSRLDFAFIEYGTTAVVVAPYLERLGIPYAINFHGYDASASLGDQAYRDRIKQVVRRAQFYIVPSQHLRRRVELIGLSDVPCHVLPYSPNYQHLPKSSVPAEPVVVSLGRLTGKKCPEALVMMASLVLAEVPGVAFKFIGGGPLSRETQDLVNELRVGGSVTLVGELPHKESLELIAAATLFVQHSVTSSTGDQEGFPVALAEAAALGKVIVSTIHSGIVENVIHGRSGYLVQEHDYETMAKHVIELLRNPALCKEMGHAGQKQILEVAPPDYREKQIVKLIGLSLENEQRINR